MNGTLVIHDQAQGEHPQVLVANPSDSIEVACSDNSGKTEILLVSSKVKDSTHGGAPDLQVIRTPLEDGGFHTRLIVGGNEYTGAGAILA